MEKNHEMGCFPFQKPYQNLCPSPHPFLIPIGVDTMDLLAKAIIAGLELMVAVILAALKEDDE